jgi:hypothetical protein
MHRDDITAVVRCLDQQRVDIRADVLERLDAGLPCCVRCSGRPDRRADDRLLARLCPRGCPKQDIKVRTVRLKSCNWTSTPLSRCAIATLSCQPLPVMRWKQQRAGAARLRRDHRSRISGVTVDYRSYMMICLIVCYLFVKYDITNKSRRDWHSMQTSSRFAPVWSACFCHTRHMPINRFVYTAHLHQPLVVP